MSAKQQFLNLICKFSGAEALARVPEEFVTQRNTNANPPTFFLTLVQMFGENHGDFNTSSEEYQTLNRMFTRLQVN